MREAAVVDEMLVAAKAVRITFEDVPTPPACVREAGDVEPQEATEIIERYARHGFVIIQVGSRCPPPEALRALTEALSLGEPFVPPLYATGNYVGGTISRISAAVVGEGAHPSFEGTGGLEFHCDGTLQPIGYVKASALLCESPGVEGGESTLFNAAAAYAELAGGDVAAAAALATEGVLTRQANINGRTDMNVGPAFAVRDGQLACNYSVTATDRWNLEAGVDEADLRRGVDFLRRASEPGSPFFLKLGLGAGQAILMDNSRISHGRTPYRNSDAQRRCLYRSLHLHHPRVRALA